MPVPPGVPTMYGENAISSTAAMAHGKITPLPVDDEMTEATLASLRRLQSAFVELSTALNETLHDKRSAAVESLRRAEAMLNVRHQHALHGLAEIPRQGLAPWQVRRVLTYID